MRNINQPFSLEVPFILSEFKSVKQLSEACQCLSLFYPYIHVFTIDLCDY